MHSESEAGGTKLSMTFLLRRLAEAGVDVDRLWHEIAVIILKSLACVEDSIPHQVRMPFLCCGMRVLEGACARA